MHRCTVLACLLVCLGCTSGPAPAGVPGEQTAAHFEKEIMQVAELDYLVYLPVDYGAPGGPWSLVLFLHGAGERGDDLEMVKMHGPPKLVAEGRAFPAIIVSPQCPAKSWWTSEAPALSALLDELPGLYDIDPHRIYLTGLSMGGYGTWALAAAGPDRFAALAPICGGGDPADAAAIAHIPTWVFHGAKDNVVGPEQSKEMVEALEAAGGDPKLTIYPEAGHDSWTATYASDEFWGWLFAQRRRPAGQEETP